MPGWPVVAGLLATEITWDPFIRGVLIVVVAVGVLVGSVYLLLATNLGARVGFLVAVAALTGWIGTMGILWSVFGIGAVGRTPSWAVEEVVAGGMANATTVARFPRGFTRIKTGDPELGDLTTTGDKALASSAASAPPAPGKEATESKPSRFTPPFSKPDEYVVVGAYKKDPTLVWHIRHHKFTPLGHSTHIDVLQVQPAVKQPDTGGAPPKPAADTTKPVTSVVLKRNLGSLRQPQLFISVSAFVIFGVCCNVLHRRDRQIFAAKAAAAAGSTA